MTNARPRAVNRSCGVDGYQTVTNSDPSARCGLVDILMLFFENESGLPKDLAVAAVSDLDPPHG